MERVNIIMASYQGEKYIEEQLESILESTKVDVFVTVYDDGSKDRTKEIVSSYEKQYPGKVKLILNEHNLGLTKNFLHGLLDNEFSYVMFSDQDDVWNPDKVKKTLDCMKREEEKQPQGTPVIVFTDALVVDGELNPMYPSFHRSQGLDTSKLDLAHMMMENKMMGCTMMLNRGMIEKVTQLPEHARYHDWWLGLIAAAYGTIVYLPEATIKYRQHGKNMVGNQSFGTYVANRISSLREQRKALYATVQQAEEFYKMYQETMPKDQLELVRRMVEIKSAGFFRRRYLVLKNGFLKSGVTRNLGLLLII